MGGLSEESVLSGCNEDRGPVSPAGGDGPGGDRLDSWKEVAIYLGRDVRTVQRWERREGLPIHRHQHDKIGSVFALRLEVDAWRAARSNRVEEPRGDTAIDPEAAASPAPDQPADAPASIGPLPSGRDGGQRLRLAAGAVAVTVLVAAAAWLSLRQPGPIAGAARTPIRSLVVLPFENLSGDPTQDFFAAGLTEEVTARLAQLKTLRVVSRTSAMSLQGRKMPVPTIANDMDVDGVVEGSVRSEAGRVRISVQLIDGRTDTHVWARDFDRELAATWPLQIEVAQAVAEVIRVEATPEERTELAAFPSVAPAARDEYLLGRHLLWKFIEADRVRAIAHFERAIRIDPQYAAPYAALAHAWWMRGVFGALSLKDVAAPAREAALAALARDDRNAEAYAALAYVQGMFDWEWSRALTTVQRAVTLQPNNVDARYVHAVLLMAMGRLDEATSEIAYAARLDPLSAQVRSTYGRVLYRARRFDEARVQLERALELEPRNAGIYARLANVHEQAGRYEDALAALRAVEAPAAIADHFWIARARILAHAGRTAEARRVLASVPAQSPPRAEVLAALRDHEAAFAALYSALDRRDSWLLFIKTDPVFEAMHRDPRWADVLRRMGLDAHTD